MELSKIKGQVKNLSIAAKQLERESARARDNALGTRAQSTTARARYSLAAEQWDRMEKKFIEICEKIAAGDCINRNL